MDEQQRAAALMQARMARSNGSVPAGAPPPRRRVHFDPRIDQTPSQSPQQLRPQPPVVKPVSRVTGSSMMIPPKSDPANTYKNEPEAMTASSSADSADDRYPGINVLVRMLVFALLVGGLFVVPTAYKPFWITVVGTAMLAYIGFQLYYEWDRKAFLDSTSADDATKYKSWAIGMLYAMNILVTSVVAGILIVMVWRIYSMARARSNLISSAEPPASDTVVVTREAAVLEPSPAATHGGGAAVGYSHGVEHHHMMHAQQQPMMVEQHHLRKKKKKRRMPFV